MLALFLFLSIITNFGCRKKAIIGTQIPDFPKVYSLAGEDLPWINLLSPIKMVVSDSLLIIEDNSSPYFFYIFNLKTQKLLSKFGGRGKGPGEFTDFPIFRGQITKNAEGTWIVYYHNGFNTLYSYRIEDALQNILPFRVLEYPLPKSYSFPRSMILLKGNTIFGTLMEPEINLFAYELPSKTFTKLTGHTDNPEHPSHPDLRTTIDMENLISKPDESGFFGYFQYQKRIHIYDQNAKLMHDLVDMNDYNWPDFSLSDEIPDSTMVCFVSGFATNSLIYALNFNSSSGRDETGKSEIWVFDWNGNPVTKYTLDALTYVFAIDEENELIYSHPVDSDYIRCYNIPRHN